MMSARNVRESTNKPLTIITQSELKRMTFKHKCFIRKNNEFLRKTLKKLGYVEIKPIDNNIIIVTNDGHDMYYFTTIKEDSIKNLLSTFIDCGISETLFLAIAAITDEHDKFQFFTTLSDQQWVNQGVYCPKGSLKFCMVKDRFFGENPLFTSMIPPSVKSSVEDLIKNFKDKEEDTEWFSKIPEDRWEKNIYDLDPYPLTDEEKEMLDKLIRGNNINNECKYTIANTEI